MSIDLTDEALMLAVKEGNAGNLGILFERYHARLFDFFCRMNGNPSVSEDLVQDVFFRILKYRGTFRTDSKFTTWMYQIARNARLQHFRKLAALVEPVGNIPEVSVNGSNSGRLYEDEEAARMLQRALQELPEETRELLILAWFQEMKYDEIAELFTIETGAVKVRVHRAVRELREIYLKMSGEKAPCNVKKS